MTEQKANKFICPVCSCSIITSREITEQIYCIQCARDRPNEALLWVANNKIQKLQTENEKLKKDIIELVELGTDQVVTEKIQKLQAQLASAREIFKELNDGCFCNFRYRTDVSQWIRDNES
jgi:hypothetical protein